MAFVVDTSGSIQDDSPQNWIDMKDFVKRVINEFDINNAHFAAVTFGTLAQIEFDFAMQLNSKPLYFGAVDSFTYNGGSTNITGALRLAEQELFSPRGGDRGDVQDLIILIIDGKPTREENLLATQVDLIKRRGIDIIAIGITNQVDRQQMLQLVSSPAGRYYFHVDQFNQLASQLYGVVDQACRSITPTPQPTPRPTPRPSPSRCICWYTCNIHLSSYQLHHLFIIVLNLMYMVSGSFVYGVHMLYRSILLF